jgi:hypothetical protein
MALKIPKFFSAADAKSRVFLIFGAIVGVGLLVYIGVRLLGGGESASGPSKVATAPSSLQTVPGGQMSPEFYRAVTQANAQAAQQAQMTGGSAVPTLVNVPTQQPSGFPQASGNCTVLCSDEAIDISNDINDIVKLGKLPQEDANHLIDLAKKNVSVEEYAAALDELVRQGKLTPEQARALLEKYKKQHQAVLTAESAQTMDALIKSGQLPLGVANELLALQKSNLSPAEYAAELNRLVKEGKISPELAAQLLAQYTQQRAREATQSGIFGLKKMAKNGEITADVAESLAALQNRNIPVDQYAAELDRLVAAGKMTPAAAAKLLDQYKKQRAIVGATGSLNAMLNEAQSCVVTQLSDLMKSGKISSEAANALFALQQKNVPFEEFQTAVNQLAQSKKIPPQDVQQLIDCYKKLVGLRALTQQLSTMQGNNASPEDYTNALKQAVQAGVITPDMAQNLLQEYRTISAPVNAGVIPGVDANIPGAADFAKLQQRLQSQSGEAPAVQTQEFTAAASQAQADLLAQRNERIQQLAGQMSNQAQTLITSWQPPTMVHQAGQESTDQAKTPGAGGGPGGLPPGTSGSGGSTTAPTGAPIIKSGTILFAVLDTGVDSDYPDTPVMATIVEGKFKGARLLGKMALVSGKDKLSLTFNMMDRDDWARGKPISAFAIDPDTARTVMASSVDNHYLSRYGAMIASSFLSGYASAISSSGSTTTTGIFGSTTSNPALSPGNKLAIGLGKVGDSLTKVVTKYVDTPATIKVNSGVGLGILFMADVTE